MNGKVLVLGGSSEIIHSTILSFAEADYDVGIICSSQESLQRKLLDFNNSVPKIKGYKLDLGQDKATSLFVEILQAFQPDILIIAAGYLPAHNQLAQVDKTLKINFTAVAQILAAASEYFKSRQRGKIAVLSSVAGERGRCSNYVYGSAKAGLTCFLSGLRAELSHFNVSVLTVKLGIVDTRMSRSTGKVSGLAISKEKAGKAIFIALKRNKDVVYIPSFWRFIMFVIRNIPEVVFKHLKI